MNATSIKAKFFTTRCGINHAVQLQDISCIIIITDAIPAAKQIFNISIHLYQLHSIAISKDFFNRNPNNSIAFWDCPNTIKWSLHLLVDKESKHLRIDLILLSKTSWELSKKECNTIIDKWQMYFQASEYKERNFLELNSDDHQPICPTYSKGGAWLKHFSLSNSMCVHITRLITNHAPIGEYRLMFFPKELFVCMCGDYPIEMRRHILFNCVQYKKSWNPKRKSLKDILEFNPGVFCFQESIN